MSHRCPISSSLRVAATATGVLLLASCSDLTLPPSDVSGIADLIVFSQQPNAPAPAPETAWVFNSRQTIVRINHPDNFNTLYLELSFPARSLASLDGTVLSDTDSIEITIDPRPGEYGFVLSPSGLAFATGLAPTATFSFSVYGDASAGGSSVSYGNSAEYVAALDIWREITVDEWQIAPNSRAAGVDAVSANVEMSGRFLLAAPR